MRGPGGPIPGPKDPRRDALMRRAGGAARATPAQGGAHPAHWWSHQGNGTDFGRMLVDGANKIGGFLFDPKQNPGRHLF